MLHFYSLTLYPPQVLLSSFLNWRFIVHLQSLYTLFPSSWMFFISRFTKVPTFTFSMLTLIIIFSEKSPWAPRLGKSSRYILSYYLIPSSWSIYLFNFSFICVMICFLYEAKAFRRVETILVVLTIGFP